MNKDAINNAIQYLTKRGYKLPIEVLQMKSGKSLPEMKSVIDYVKNIASKQMGYDGIRSTLWAAVYDDVYNYLTSTSYAARFRVDMATALGQAYISASEQAWTDGGGSLPIDDDTLSWAKSEIDAQMAYVESLFQTLKQLRKETDTDPIHEAFVRADGYASALDGFYNNVKASAFGGKMLTFVGSDGRESCSDCRRLKNQRKRASWWVSHELVPPSRMFECKGYNCDHYLIDDKGEVFTV